MQEKLNALIIANYGAEYPGNFIPSIIKLKEEICNQEGNVIFIFPERAKIKNWCSVLRKTEKIYFIEESRSNSRVKHINKIISDNRCNIVYSHFGYDNELALLSWVHPQVKFFRHSHTDMNEKMPIYIRLRQFVKKYTFTLRLRTIAVSKELTLRKGDYYLPNALVTDRLKYDVKQYIDIRGINGISAKKIFALMFGWHFEIKGMDIAGKAFQILNKINSNIVLGIVYSKKDGLNEVKRKLKKFVSEETIEKIIFLEQTEYIYNYHAAADIFLSSSRSEGFPYSILEALYLGKMVVFSDISGTKWVNDFPTAVTFKSESPQDCSSAIQKAINLLQNKDIDLRRELSKRKIVKEYSINNWVSSVIRILMGKMDSK